VGLPVALLVGTPDGVPDRLDLPLGGEQVGLVGLVAQHLAVAEVDELEHLGYDAAQPPQDQGVELHLEERLGLEELRGRAARLVVDHPDLARRGDVQPVDVSPQYQA